MFLEIEYTPQYLVSVNDNAWNVVHNEVRPILYALLVLEDFEGMAHYWRTVGRDLVTKATQGK
jgi:hypothetical protein